MTAGIAGRRLLAGLVLMLAAPIAQPQDAQPLIAQTLVGAHRSAENKARDKYRHPKETLLFFGLQPDLVVVEISPCRGWYTELLAPVLRDRGQYYAVVSAITEKSPDALK